MNVQQIISELDKVEHPYINYSLIKLGIVADIKITDNKISVVFAFPFPDIPIADILTDSIEKTVRSLGFGFSQKIRIMNEVEKTRFIQLEEEGWKNK